MSVGVDEVEGPHGVGGDLNAQFPVGEVGEGGHDRLDQLGDEHVLPRDQELGFNVVFHR